MASKAASKRVREASYMQLSKESSLMEKDPPPLCFARPREDNILEWYGGPLTQALYFARTARYAVRGRRVLGPAAVPP